MGFINKFMTGGYHLVEARFYRSYYTNTHINYIQRCNISHTIQWGYNMVKQWFLVDISRRYRQIIQIRP
jgi:hypothetical protein